ncbi:hypothetical protein BKA80DRAFT_272092 [Phyllosticta citrichinensis]
MPHSAPLHPPIPSAVAQHLHLPSSTAPSCPPLIRPLAARPASGAFIHAPTNRTVSLHLLPVASSSRRVERVQPNPASPPPRTTIFRPPRLNHMKTCDTQQRYWSVIYDLERHASAEPSRSGNMTCRSSGRLSLRSWPLARGERALSVAAGPTACGVGSSWAACLWIALALDICAGMVCVEF